MTKIAIITCQNRSLLCGGLNCLRDLKAHKGTFSRYTDEIELVGFTNCGGCPGNLAKKKAYSLIRYSGAEKIHLTWCIYRSFPSPTKSVKQIKAELDLRTATRPNESEFNQELAECIKSGQLPPVCPFKKKMKKDIETLGVEVIQGTHTPLAELAQQ